MTYLVKFNTGKQALLTYVYRTDYMVADAVNGLTYSYSEAEGKSGSGFLVAPGYILTAYHVTKDRDNKIIVNQTEYTITGLDSAYNGSGIVYSRNYVNQTQGDLALVKLADYESVPNAPEFARIGYNVKNASNYVSYGFPGVFENDELDKKIPAGTYSVTTKQNGKTVTKLVSGLEVSTSVATQFENTATPAALSLGASGLKVQSDKISWRADLTGAAGHSGGPLFAENADGAYLIGNFTLANATGPINGPIGRGIGVGGMLLTRKEVEIINRYQQASAIDLIGQGREIHAGDLGMNYIGGSSESGNSGSADGDSRKAAIVGTWRADNLVGGEGNDIIYTGNTFEVGGGTYYPDSEIGDYIQGGGGNDLVILGRGVHMLAKGSKESRLAILCDLLTDPLDANGVLTPDAGAEHIVVLKGGVGEDAGQTGEATAFSFKLDDGLDATTSLPDNIFLGARYWMDSNGTLAVIVNPWMDRTANKVDYFTAYIENFENGDYGINLEQGRAYDGRKANSECFSYEETVNLDFLDLRESSPAETAENSAPYLTGDLLSASFSAGATNVVNIADIFADDEGDALSFALASVGDPLPEWIFFDAVTGDIRGAPPSEFVGSFDLMVTATDGRHSASDMFTLEVGTAGDVSVAAAMSDQSADEDGVVQFSLASDTFSSASGQPLTLSARLVSGEALPDWLSFDAATGRFSGAPPANFNGVMSIRVTASDADGAASDDFDLTINVVNDPPVVAQAIMTRLSREDATWTYVVPAETFCDVDGDTLVYDAAMADGSALPSWLSFDATTRTFAGTPPANWNGMSRLAVTATDPAGGSATAAFSLIVTPVNDAPVVAREPARQSATSGATWYYVAPSYTFFDVDGDRLVYDAKMADGSALPVWLTFDAATRAFSGAPPSTFAGALSIVLTAADPDGMTAATSLTLDVSGAVNLIPITGGLWGGSTIQGTSASDTIIASGWNNLIIGGGGDDNVNAGQGNATVTTGAGDDTIVLQGYNNIVNAGDGDNRVTGSQGATRVIVGEGANFISTVGYNNSIVAGGGNNVIIAGAGSEAITVGNGSNFVTLDGYNNVVELGSGANVVTGGCGSNMIVMNGGVDEISLYGWGNHVIANDDAHALVHDIGHGTTFDIGASNVQLAIEMFDANGVINLMNHAGGFDSGDAAKAALIPDGRGGSMLSLGPLGSINFLNVAPSQIAAWQIHMV